MIASSRRREIHLGDRVFQLCLMVLAWGVVALLLTMAAMVFYLSWPAFQKFGPGFLIGSEWNNWTGEFGALPMIYGTLVSATLALILAVPVGVGVGLFLTELAPRGFAAVIGFLVEMLAAIPSIVYGLWGFFVMAPWLRDHVQPALAQHLGKIPLFSGVPMGIGMMAAGLILAIMITPTIAAVSREVFLAVPRNQREAALGLGATRWETIRIAVLKPGMSGVIAASMLGFGRALGETMAVTMVIGNRPQIALSLFAPGQSMASLLANQYAEADGDLHLAALTGVGFALLLISLLVNAVARLVVNSVENRLRGGQRR